MRQGMSWYKREPHAFLAGVQGLGPSLIGAYAVLLDLLYARGGESTRDDHHLGGILGCSSRKAKALTDALIALGKIQTHDGFITNSRALQQSKDARTKREANVKRGRKGGEKSGEVRKNNALAEASASFVSEAEKSREEIEEKEKKKKPSVSKKKIGKRLPEEFEPRPCDVEAMKQKGATEGHQRYELEKFRDYWAGVAGAKGTKLDWDATYRNWIRKSTEGGRGNFGPVYSGGDESIGGQRIREVK